MTFWMPYINALSLKTKALNKAQKVLFCCLLAERQVTYYKAVSEYVVDLNFSALRKQLDICWAWLINDLQKTNIDKPNISAFFNKNDPQETITLSEPIITVLSIVHFILNAEEDISEISITNSINILEHLLYDFLDLEVCNANDEILSNHELFKTETTRQLEDLKIVSALVLNTKNIEALKIQSQKQKLLLEYSLNDKLGIA